MFSRLLEKDVLLGDLSLTDRSVSELLIALKMNRRLEFLNLRNNEFSDVGIELIMQELATFDLLREINLRGNRITNRGAIAVADLIRNGKSVKVLNLRSNQISAHGAEAIVRAVIEKGELEKVYLEDNPIRESSAQKIFRRLKESRLEDIVAIELGSRCDIRGRF